MVQLSFFMRAASQTLAIQLAKNCNDVLQRRVAHGATSKISFQFRFETIAPLAVCDDKFGRKVTDPLAGAKKSPAGATGASNKAHCPTRVSGRQSAKFRPSAEFLAAFQRSERLVKVCRERFFRQREAELASSPCRGNYNKQV
jgi:hypothetical protein